MSWNPSKILTWTLCLVLVVSGCASPMPPAYWRDTGDMSYYLEQATQIEYPDVETAQLEEVTQALSPITVIHPDFNSFYDVSLEDCVSMALQNSKVLRGYGTPSLQGTRVSPGFDNLSTGPAAAGTIYNVAVRETEPGFIGTAGQISSPSGVLTNTGLDVNQGVEAALADFDAQFSSSIFWNRSDEPRNTIPTNPLEPLVFFQDSVQWQAEVAKKSANGTQLFFRNVNQYIMNNTPLASNPFDPGFQVLDEWYRTALEFEVRQPLLRGRGAFIQRMPVIISRIGTDQELANLEAQLQNMVTNVEIRYWDLHCAYRNLKTAKEGRDAALKTWRIVNDQMQVGADVNKQELAQAAEQYHFFETTVIDAYNNLLNAEGNLRFLIGLAQTDGRVLRPSDEPTMAPVEFDWCASLGEALAFRPELRLQRWEIKKRELALAYSKNALLPEFNVTALYRFLGLGDRYATNDDNPQDFPNRPSGAWTQLWGGDYQEFQFGGEYRFPIGFRRELANVRNAQLKLARDLARLEDAELDVSREMTEAIRALDANQYTMHLAFNRWRETTIEEDFFKDLRIEGVEGKDPSGLFRVLDSQRRRAQAEIAYYTALCEYNKVIALIHRRKGTILEFSGICFAEGPWPGKAYQDAMENARRRGASRHVNYGWTRPQVISRGPVGTSGGDSGAWIQPGAEYTESYPIEGTIIEGDYYLPGEMPVIQPPMGNEPTLAPEVLPQPNTLLDNSRVDRDAHVQQASFTDQSPPANIVRPQPNASSSRNQNGGGAVKPQRDDSARPVKRLQARPGQNTAEKTQPPTNQPNTRTSKPVFSSSGLDWEKFGLSSPGGTRSGTRATIKTTIAQPSSQSSQKLR